MVVRSALEFLSPQRSPGLIIIQIVLAEFSIFAHLLTGFVFNGLVHVSVGCRLLVHKVIDYVASGLSGYPLVPCGDWQRLGRALGWPD